MARVFDRADSAIEELLLQLEKEARRFGYDRDDIDDGLNHPPGSVLHILHSVRDYVFDIEKDFRSLKIFLYCVQEWSDAQKAVPDLGSLVSKLEAALEKFQKQLGFAQKTDYHWATKLTFPFLTLQLICPQRWASKFPHVFETLEQEISVLKPQLNAACDSLFSHTFQWRSPMDDYHRWKDFASTVVFEVREIQFLQEVCNHSEFEPLGEQINAFTKRLELVIDFLGRLAEIYPKSLDIEDVMIHVGRVVLEAGILSLQCRSSESLADKANDITATVLHLQEKIDFTNPEFVDMNLRLLQTLYLQSKTGNNALQPMHIFVEHIFTLPTRYPPQHFPPEALNQLHNGLRILSTCYYSEIVQRFLLSDFKTLVMEVASLEYFLRKNYEARGLFINLLMNIWLVEVEIFLRDQLRAQEILSVEDLSSAVIQEIRLLDPDEGRELLKEFCYDSPEEWYHLWTFMEDLSRVVQHLNDVLHAKKITKKMVRNMLYKLLLQIMLFKARSFLLKLHKDNESLMAFVKDQTEDICLGLYILALFARDQAESSTEDTENILEHSEAVATSVISVCSSFSTNKIKEEMVNDMDLFLSNCIDDIKLTLNELKKIYLPAPVSNFPQTNGLGFIDSLLRKLSELLNQKAHLIVSIKHQIEEICGHLEFFRSFLGDIEEQDIEIQGLKDLTSRVVGIGYEAEYHIDSFVGRIGAEWLCRLWLYHFLQDIKLIKMQVEEVRKKKTCNARGHNVVQTSVHIITKTMNPRIDEAMVCLNDEEEVIIDRLTGGFLQLDVVSIVGMAGIGKTTLAKRVYNSPRVVYHFYIRAWCCVSVVYQKRELLLDILSHINALTDDILGMTIEDLELKLYQLLKQKRYLIAMDDMWSTGAWDDLVRSFPNDGNGSRILITSRLHDVALKAKGHTDPHPLRLLSEAESWELLQMKIFSEDHCSEELMESGKRIAKSCKGLPLAIVATAGILGRIRQKGWWEEIAEDLNSRIADDPQTLCMSILGLSYKHLPSYLKPCFLYVGAFREDEDIPVRKLIQLWIAEGFIQETESRCLEDLGEDYLKDLIGRSLVMFTRRRSKGGVKTCRVHDMLRILCQSKAQEDNFFRLITRFDGPDASFVVFDYGVDLNYYNPPNSIRCEDYRLFIMSKRKHFTMSRLSGTRVRSLLFSATSDTYPRCPYDMTFIHNNFRHIKVLDLECINMGSHFPQGITYLVHLRYLAACGDFDFIPPSIADLWNLETFLVKGLKGNIELPDTFWRMEKLRHVHVRDHAVFILRDDQPGCSSHLANLVTLSSPVLFYGENTCKMLRQFSSLQKLGCIFMESRDNSQNCNQFPSLDILTQLDSLKISYYGRALHPGEFNFPINLKKLTLSNFRLPWNHISVIGRLKNLEVLKLRSRAFEGDIWDMDDTEFSKLKFLKLDTLNIVEWKASCDHLPNLQQLVLRCCKQLKEVPSSFGEIPTLEIIEVQWCGDCAEKSARKILEEAGERLKVFINL